MKYYTIFLVHEGILSDLNKDLTWSLFDVEEEFYCVTFIIRYFGYFKVSSKT